MAAGHGLMTENDWNAYSRITFFLNIELTSWRS